VTPLAVFYSNKQRVIAFGALSFIFLFHLSFEFYNYKLFKHTEVFQTDAQILNIYHKKKYHILKLKNDDFTFFTSIPKEHNYQKLQKINLFLLTKKVSFVEYLKGFYTHSFHINTYKENDTFIKSNFYDFINSQHLNSSLGSLYSALYLAINTDQTIKELTAQYGISHLIAISGFHLGVMSVVLYFLLHLFYSPLHQKYLPYRNKRYDILVTTALILFCYLILLDFVPSLLRAFTMLVFGLIMLRNNIKILSFETLLWIVLTIIAFFPNLLFSLSLWFSVSGVFYIFLFLHYFQSLNKYIQILFFNFWIYLAMNPIVHFFFPITSYEQLLSPLLTLLFTIFYPVSLVLHLLGIGNLFDPVLEYIINIDIFTFDKPTSTFVFMSFIALSLASIFSKKAFVGLNIAIVGFSVYLFVY
jgi:competence protein ComEC